MRLSEGSNSNVKLSELEGDEDICIQLLKLLADNCNEPEQLVFVLVLTLSIASENVTEMDVETEVMLSEFDGEVEITVGRVVSISNKPIVSVCDEFDALSITVIVQVE